MNTEIKALTIGITGSLAATIIYSVVRGVSPEVGAIVALSLICVGLVILHFLTQHASPGLPMPNAAGISDIQSPAGTTAASLMLTAINSVDFWGISARRTFSDPAVKRHLIGLLAKGGTVRVLLLDPDSHYVTLRAAAEHDSPTPWSREINATADRLTAWHDGESWDPTQLKIRFYDAMPIWRALYIDNNRLHLHYFLDAKQGPESPLILVERGQDSIYWAYRSAFEYAWSIARDHNVLNT